MSNVALSGNASGTGTFTIASPNSNTDRTLDLPDNSGTVVSTGSTAAVTQAMLETLVVPLGVGQTWQSVTRTSGVTYTNTTGRPILVSFYTGTATPGNAFVNGVGITTSASASNFTFVVPAGATYSCFSISAASELR